MLFEDEHLLVVNKPAGLNTHSPSPYAGEGIYDWLRNREARWENLAIIHRLDKQTSGVLAFSLSAVANRSLTAQFANRQARKTYLLLTDRLDAPIPRRHRSNIVKVGDKFVNRPWSEGAAAAETEFMNVASDERASLAASGYVIPPGTRLVKAHPLTGRTHQIRLHASALGFPVLGDTLYGGTAADRVYLHAWQLQLKHPETGAAMTFKADWSPGSATSQLRKSLFDPEETNAFRLLHGAADFFPSIYVDRLGDFLLAQTEDEIEIGVKSMLEELARRYGLTGIYHKRLMRHTRGKGVEASPVLLSGNEAPDRFVVRENGLSYELSFREGYSIGLFLDQRDNRQRLLTGHIARGFPLSENASKPNEVLNTFAYTCGFSVAAAKHGARTTSLDLSKKYLEWGQRNFSLNAIPLSGHDFVYGDAFEWLKRFGRKGRKFDVILLDPPTFSQSREHGVFRAQKDYGPLMAAALPLLKENGLLFASSNAAHWMPQEFVAMLALEARKAGRRIQALNYAPQPPDFPISREEPAYLKTAWCRMR